MPFETELKFEVAGPSTFGQIAALNKIMGYALDDRGIVHIRDTAFDTSDNSLYRGGAVFRLREMCGARYLTFKTHAPSDGDYYRRIEDEAPTAASVADIAAGRLPDIPPSVLFRERFGDVSLTPCLTTDNDRHIFFLKRNVDPCYELAMDDVTFTGPRGEAHIREIEIEAMTEEYGDLNDIGVWLRDRYGLTIAGPSKFVHGMDLVGLLS